MTSIIPAINVAIINPPVPNCWIIPYIMTINAPVGPPICTLVPPNADIINPAIIAVTNPSVGPTPLAIPNAMANGIATIPTIIPAIKSVENCFLE